MKDPLVAATVGKLPAAGTPWPQDERDNWFDLMRKCVAVTYGPPPRPGAAAGEAPHFGEAPITSTKYYIQPDGTAVADGRPIDPHQIPPGTVVLDYRPLPIDEEYNPIMWLTHGAKAIKLPNRVIVRPAKEPMPTAATVNGSAEASA